MNKNIVIDLHFLTPYALNIVGTSNQKSIWEACSSKDGKSAYKIAQDNGFVGTEVEWLASLHSDNNTEVGTYVPISSLQASDDFDNA